MTLDYIHSREEIRPFTLTCMLHVIHGMGNAGNSDFGTALANPENRAAIERVYVRLVAIRNRGKGKGEKEMTLNID